MSLLLLTIFTNFIICQPDAELLPESRARLKTAPPGQHVVTVKNPKGGTYQCVWILTEQQVQRRDYQSKAD